MSFDLKRFLKRLPPNSLKAYFLDRSGEAKDLDWSQPPRDLVGAIIALIESLAPGRRVEILSDLERVAQFDEEAGRRALRAVAINRDDVLATLDTLEGVEACALYMLIIDPDTFERALAVHYATRLRNGRDWSGMELLGGGALEVDDSEVVLTLLGDQMRSLFRSDGAGERRVKVESFPIRVDDPATGEVDDQIQFTVYVEQMPETLTVFDDRLDVVRRTVSRLAEAAVVVDARKRTIDIVANGGKELRQKIAETFARQAISGGTEVRVRPRRKLRLDMFKVRPSLPVLPSDHVRRVDVEGISLGAPGGAGGLVRIERKSPQDGSDGDLYASVQRWFGLPPLPERPGWWVLSVKIRVVFEPEAKGRRPKAVAVELKYPDRTNLRDQTRYHCQIADSLLSRWGLYEDDAQEQAA